jgi:hypothetical protein
MLSTIDAKKIRYITLFHFVEVIVARFRGNQTTIARSIEKQTIIQAEMPMMNLYSE